MFERIPINNMLITSRCYTKKIFESLDLKKTTTKVQKVFFLGQVQNTEKWTHSLTREHLRKKLLFQLFSGSMCVCTRKMDQNQHVRCEQIVQATCAYVILLTEYWCARYTDSTFVGATQGALQCERDVFVFILSIHMNPLIHVRKRSIHFDSSHSHKFTSIQFPVFFSFSTETAPGETNFSI